ncbi:MAG: DUF3572 family protein [Xanthobacteraceae bacterium]|nr:MAG: DUF3572 family protein [Xanthobacteraceae bacterium]
MIKSRPDARQAAEIVAIKALGFIAGEPARLGAFLAESGIGPETLRAAAGDPQFLIGVMDFVLRDDALVTAFAEIEELRPDQVRVVRDLLAGPRWEREVP